MNIIKKFAAFSLVAFALAGCGQTPGERAVSGAGIGAGVGALGSAVTGGSVGGGALVGGLAGGAVGGLTKPSDVNLGKPVWQ